MTFLIIFLWAWAVGATVGFWHATRGWEQCNEKWSRLYREMIDQRLIDHVRAVHGKPEVRA